MDYSDDVFNTCLCLDSVNCLAVNGTVTSFPVFIQNILNCAPRTNKAFTGLEWHRGKWLIIKLRWALFVTYTITQSITSSEMCSLHLTHQSAHTLGTVGSRCCPGSSWGFSALLKGLTSVMNNSCRGRDSNPQPRVTSPTLYPLVTTAP